MQRSGDRADARVPEVEEIVGRLAAGGEIVDRHGIDVRIVDGAAEQDDGGTFMQPAGAIVIGAADRDQDRAVASEIPDAVEDALLGVRVLVAVENDESIAPGRGRSFGGPDDAGVEWIGEVGDRKRDQLRAAALQVAGNLRRRIAELGDRRSAPARADRR